MCIKLINQAIQDVQAYSAYTICIFSTLYISYISNSVIHLDQCLDQFSVISLCQFWFRGQMEDALKGFFTDAPLALSLMCITGKGGKGNEMHWDECMKGKENEMG